MTQHNAASGVYSAADRLVVITPNNQDIRNEFSRAFTDWHRVHYGSEIVLDFRIPGGSNDVKRQLAATYQAYRDPATGRLPDDVPADISVVWGGGDFFFDQELKPLGILQPMNLTPGMLREFTASFPQPTLAGVKLYDPTITGGNPTPMWIGCCLSSFGVCYNPDVYGAMGLPLPRAEHGWSDLADPRLAGWIALADPAHAGSAAVAYQMVIQHKMARAEADLLRAMPGSRRCPKPSGQKTRPTNPPSPPAGRPGWPNS